MAKIKIFRADSLFDLEKEVNKFIKHFDFENLEFHYQHCDTSSYVSYSVMIVVKDFK